MTAPPPDAPTPGGTPQPGSDLPPGHGYPPQGPPPAQGYPPPGYGYPPHGSPPGQGYPPPGQGYPPPGYGPPPPGWGQQPWGQPGWGPARGTNTLAVVALVAVFVFAPAALVLGIIARRQIQQTGEDGAGMALAAIICGAIAVVFFVLVMGLVLTAFVVGAGHAATVHQVVVPAR